MRERIGRERAKAVDDIAGPVGSFLSEASEGWRYTSGSVAVSGELGHGRLLTCLAS